MSSVALIGDYNPTVIAHQAIPAALDRAVAEGGLCVGWTWVRTSGLGAEIVKQLDGFSALWCVPGSPYANTAGALAAIRFARETGRPFLGTCGGFQHALLEYAEAVWGLSTAAHAELDPEVPDPLIAKLDCALVEAVGESGRAGLPARGNLRGHAGNGDLPLSVRAEPALRGTAGGRTYAGERTRWVR